MAAHGKRRQSPREESPPPTESTSVSVIIRARPTSSAEHDEHSPVCLQMHSQEHQVLLFATSSSSPRHSNRRSSISDTVSALGHTIFSFDRVFHSCNVPDICGAAPSGQAEVYEAIGRPLVTHAFDGFNSCLLAYGQTGSGKTYTMMGADVGELRGDGAGVTPRLCEELFARRGALTADGNVRWAVDLGYVEVYNEKVWDLLARRQRGEAESVLEVREHPSRGVYMDGQRFIAVDNCDEVIRHIERGNAARHTAETKMNSRSSRSHAIVMLLLREERMMKTDDGVGITTSGKTSRMNLVDLAGSERVARSEAAGQRLREATHINLSLTTLGRIIDVLADMARKGPNSQYSVAPYRDAKLTHILRDSLGGNSKTIMVATVSPTASSYDETLSTLRYASRSRVISTCARVNEPSVLCSIRELNVEVESMRAYLCGGAVLCQDEVEARLEWTETEARYRMTAFHLLEMERLFERTQGELRVVGACEKLCLERKLLAVEERLVAARDAAESAREKYEEKRRGHISAIWNLRTRLGGLEALLLEKDERIVELESLVEQLKRQNCLRPMKMTNSAVYSCWTLTSVLDEVTRTFLRDFIDSPRPSSTKHWFFGPRSSCAVFICFGLLWYMLWQ